MTIAFLNVIFNVGLLGEGKLTESCIKWHCSRCATGPLFKQILNDARIAASILRSSTPGTDRLCLRFYPCGRDDGSCALCGIHVLATCVGAAIDDDNRSTTFIQKLTCSMTSNLPGTTGGGCRLMGFSGPNSMSVLPRRLGGGSTSSGHSQADITHHAAPRRSARQ